MGEYEKGWDAACADFWLYGRTTLNPAARAVHTPEWIDGYEGFMATG